MLARAVERHEPGPPMHVARLTIELLRPVPLGYVEVRTRTVRPGKKVQLIEASLFADGSEVARAVGLRIRYKDVELPGRDDSVPQRQPSGIAADDRFVYWTNLDEGAVTARREDLRRLELGRHGRARALPAQQVSTPRSVPGARGRSAGPGDASA